MKKINTRLSNDELASIYDYLQGQISMPELTKEIRKTRTNAYYYLGRAMEYWLQSGILKFKDIRNADDLGGKDV